MLCRVCPAGHFLLEEQDAKAERQKFSQHQYGKAADVWIDGVSVDTLANYIDQSVLPNTGGIGRYYKDAAHPSRKQPFVHIDVRKARSRWLG